MVKIKWLGHACFEIKGREVTVVTDPHDGSSIGLHTPRSEADIVLISHGHFDHAGGIKFVAKEDATIIREESGEWEEKGVKIRGVFSYHDESRGRERGNNIIYVFEVDGVRFCHLGDLGHILTSDQVERIGDVDVLFIPVGGTYTIDAKGATEIVEVLKPKIVIPMHFKIGGISLPISSVEPFLEGKKNIERIDSSEYEVTKETLPEETKIVVLRL